MEDPSLYYNSNITLKSPFSLTSSNLIPHSQDPEAAIADKVESRRRSDIIVTSDVPI